MARNWVLWPTSAQELNLQRQGQSCPGPITGEHRQIEAQSQAEAGAIRQRQAVWSGLGPELCCLVGINGGERLQTDIENWTTSAQFTLVSTAPPST